MFDGAKKNKANADGTLSGIQSIDAAIRNKNLTAAQIQAIETSQRQGGSAAAAAGPVGLPSTLNTGLEAYYKLSEASGIRADSKGSNNLTDNNTVTNAVGKQGNAAYFTEANSEYLSIPDNASLDFADEDFTLAAWVNVHTLSAGQHRAIIGKWDSSDRGYLLALERTSGANQLFLDVTGGGGEDAVYATTFGTPVVDTWFFVVAWHDSVANTLSIQVNNGAINSIAFTFGCRNTAVDFCLGTILISGAPSNFMDGMIDEVGVWRRTLTIAERTALYNSGAGVTYS